VTSAAPGSPTGRSVLVTGGNRGIGLAIARALADAGHRVTVTHRSGEPPEGLAGVVCDVTDPASIDAAFTEVEKSQGPIEVLVSNAGITDDTLLLRMSDDTFTRVLDANLTGSYRVAKRAATGMLRKRWGRMIFISSVVGLSGGAGQANYSSSKAGLVGLARSVARELGSRNITANVIAPGFVDTDMTRALPEARRTEIIAQVPLRRYADPSEIAAAVVFLASEGAGYITGAVLPVDGGLGMGH
jgi:NAD(P)-dependent dehydrogenase (short-subunit alcohol dehydrogenase family)